MNNTLRRDVRSAALWAVGSIAIALGIPIFLYVQWSHIPSGIRIGSCILGGGISIFFALMSLAAGNIVSDCRTRLRNLQHDLAHSPK